MGSLDPSWADSDDAEITVLVTGFQPFREGHPINPSWEIAALLPDHLPDRVKDPKHTTAGPSPKVRILVYPEPIRVNYEVVRNLVPTLWDNPSQKIDYAIHIGMAGPGKTYAIERLGHRDGYNVKDVDDEFLNDEERHKEEGDGWIWHGLPHALFTDLNIEDIFNRWTARQPSGPELKISNDAGHYLCDFLYYSSLAHLWKKQQPRKVIFLHVPSNSSPSEISVGKEIALQLIRSVVESETQKTQPPTS